MAFDLSKAIEQYGPIFIYITPESGQQLYFRLVTKREYDTFNSLCDETGVTSDAEDYLYQVAIVHPSIQDLDDEIFAGEASSIVAEIAKQSGFFDINMFVGVVDKCRLDCQKLSEQIIIFITKAMPGYKIAELELLNYQQLARLLAMSEVILGEALDMGNQKPGRPRGNILERTELGPEQEAEKARLTEEARGALKSIRGR